MLHQSDSLNDAELALVSKIHSQQFIKAPQLQILCEIGIQKGDYKFLSKIYKYLNPHNRYSLKHWMSQRLRGQQYKNQKIMDEFKKNDFYSLACEQRFYIIKISYLKKDQKNRYINGVIDMFERQETKQSAKRIYKNLPYWFGKKYFDNQMKRRLQNKGGQKLYLRYIKQLSEKTCKECLQQWMTWFKNTIKKKE